MLHRPVESTVISSHRNQAWQANGGDPQLCGRSKSQRKWSGWLPLMPISRRWRLPSSGTEVRCEIIRRAQQSPRWGIVEQFGPRSRLTGNFLNVVIHDVSRVITASRNGSSVRAFEEPAILVVTLDGKTTLVHPFVMLRTQQHQVIETRFATSRPVLNVMRIDKLCTRRLTRSDRLAKARCAPVRESAVPHFSSRQRSSTRAVVVLIANDNSSSSLWVPTTRVIARLVGAALCPLGASGRDLCQGQDLERPGGRRYASRSGSAPTGGCRAFKPGIGYQSRITLCSHR